MFTFTSLLGAQSTSRASQSLLELDGGIKVLVDVGWDERFDTRQLAEIEKHTSTLSFILLTHSTLSHLGAFAHCCKHVPNFTKIPIYATSPVISFGRTLVQDLYSSYPLASTFIPKSASASEDTSADDQSRSNILRQSPSFEDINKYFTLIVPLKYSQPHQPNASPFSPPLEGLTLTAYNSGHTLGGTIWHIQHGMESIVYAVDWNQARENVISGAAWFGGVGGSEVIEQLRKPTALVCSSRGGNRIAPAGGRRARDNNLVSHIRSSLTKGGTVLIPADTSARVLELAWILERAWQDDPSLKPFKLYITSKTGQSTFRAARSLLEWMDDNMIREFEEDEAAVQATAKPNSKAGPARPFEFRHTKIVEKKPQLEKLLQNNEAKVVVASDLSLDWGYSRTVLENMASNSDNLIILTDRYNSNIPTSNVSVAGQIWQLYDERQDGVALEKSIDGDNLEQIHTGGRQLNFRNWERSGLDTDEAQKYQQYMATQRQIQGSLDTQGAGTLAAEDVLDDDSSSSSSSAESDDEQQGRALNVSSALGHSTRNKVAMTDEDLGVNILVRKAGVHDFDVRNKRGRNAVFPYSFGRKRADEFGEIIKPEDFLREEEKDGQENQASTDSKESLGQKRKWDDAVEGRDRNRKRQQIEASRRNARADSEHQSDSDSSDDEDESPQTEAIQGPSKIVFTDSTISISARLAYVDFSGLHDQRSLQMLIPLIGPKKLILTGGMSQETVSLANSCKELLSIKTPGLEGQPSSEIFTPADGETIDVSVDTNAWIVKLSRDLATKLHWQNVKNIGVVTIQGQLKAELSPKNTLQDDSRSKKQKLDTEKSLANTPPPANTAVEPVLDAVPASIAASTRSVTQPIYVGDMRLADLRKILGAAGHLAEFRGEGTLLVDGIIAVRKFPSGKIIVEGVPISNMNNVTNRTNDNFARIKQTIYSGLALVAAG